MTAPPAPLVSAKRHPFTWARQRVAALATGAIFTYVGVLIIAALYYILFELWHPMTTLWHEAVPNGELRHNIRDVGEGLFGGLLAHMFVWNHFKASVQKAPNWLDKLEIKLHIPNAKDTRNLTGWQLLAAVPIVLIYAAPGFFLAEWLVHLIKPGVAQVTGTTLLDHIKSVVTENYPQKLIGYGAAFCFGRRPAKGIFDDAQLWFAERRVGAGKSCGWWHLAAYKARCRVVAKTEGGPAAHKHETVATVMLRGAIPVGLALAGYGFYVLNYIAK